MAQRDPFDALQEENERLRERLEEAEGALAAIRTGQVESLVVEGPDGPRIFSLEGATHSYRVLVEAMNEGAATLSDEGAILYCNARLADMLGAPLEHVMGGALRDWVPEALRAGVEALLREAREGDGRGELCLRRRDGQEVPAQLSIKRFHDDGRPLLCLVATDLGEQKRNERALAEGRLARSVLEQAAEAIVVCDDKGRVSRASGAAGLLCGGDPLRVPFDVAFPVASPSLAGGVAAAALRGAVVRAEPASLTRADGSQIHLLVSAAPLRGDGDRVIGCVVSMVDVTAHRRAEEELRAAEERLRTLGDNLPDGALYRYAHGPDGTPRFLYIGAGVERLTGVAPAEILRDPAALLDTVVPEDRERFLEAEARSRETLSPLELEIRQRHRATGEVRWTLLRSVPRRLADGSTLWDGVEFNITARKEAEEALREADRNRSRFLAVLSHELRNPLAPVRNALHLLERVDPGGEQAHRAHEVIRRQFDHLARLVDDLLDVTRITSGKMQLQPEPLDVGELVRRTVEDHRAMFEGAGIALEVKLADGALPVSGDATRLAQAIGNLLQNAAKFTPRGGHVWVTLEREPEANAVALRVRDDGAGIDAAMLARLFEPFSQADVTLHRSPGGLGLGLSLVKGIVDMHGGSVSARSEGPDRGAEFVARLPLQRARARPAHAEANRPPRRPRRVLVIEDNEDSAETLRDVLELGEHAVDVARTGPEGLEKARAFAPEVILCDIGLPGMDGYQVAAAIRADPALRSVYLVALSGYAGPEHLAAAAKAGFDCHVAKPPDLDQLGRILLDAPASP